MVLRKVRIFQANKKDVRMESDVLGNAPDDLRTYLADLHSVGCHAGANRVKQWETA